MCDQPLELTSASAPTRILRAGERMWTLGDRPWLMGVVNASPDSFSDGGGLRTLEEQVERARALVAQGADVIDVGGESATTGRPPVDPGEEARRVAPLIERVVDEVGVLGVLVSVDTYKPAVARAAIAAGASIVNDVSGLRDPALAEVCAELGAALVVMHTAAAPRVRRHERDLYGDIVADVAEFLAARIAVAVARGLPPEAVIVDPGPDFAKTPAQTIALLAGAEQLHALGRPLLMAVSRKDFIGALTGRRPAERLAGTLAALADGLDRGAHVFRVHDVAAAADFVRVRRALRGEIDVAPDLALADALRHEPPRDGG